MNREEIHEKLHFGDKLDYRSFNELHEVIEEIFDYFEEKIDMHKTNEQGMKRKIAKISDALNILNNNFQFTSCDDCKNKTEGTYQEICSNCKRFYGCYFEAKEKLC